MKSKLNLVGTDYIHQWVIYFAVRINNFLDCHDQMNKIAVKPNTPNVLLLRSKIMLQWKC